MKTLILLSIVFTMAFFEDAHGKQVVDQVCTGDVTLSSQAEVDAFNCTELTGRLVISGSDITNLDALSSLRKVHGDFLIQETKLNALDGLSALDSVGGRLDISLNPLLSNTNGLSSLKRTGGMIFLENPSLTNFDGLSSLVEINGNLSIQANHALVDINGFPSLSSVTGDVSGGIHITKNANLTKVSGFNALASVTAISIKENPRLVDINGFTSVLSVDGITILQNDALTDIQGFSALTMLGGILISENSSLPDIHGFSALTTAGDILISENNSLSNLDGFPAISQVGSLSIINNRSLKSINGFNNLKAISDLIAPSGEVQLNISNNLSLEGFLGLSLLEEISGNNVAAVNINNNPALKNIDGLSSLSSINGAYRYLKIETNILLENIDGLSQLKPGDLDNPINISVVQNESLMRCDGLLPYFDSLGKDEAIRLKELGVIDVSDNGAECVIGDILNGGPIAISCDGDVFLFSQAKVDAFNCTEVKGNLIISGNDITNLNTLSSLRKVGGNLSISDNPNLETIDLPDLHIGDISVRSISISNNANLKSISGFNNTFLASSIHIGGNPKLGSISGFDSLRQAVADFGGDGFAIVQNNALTNLAAFGALKTAGNFRIVNNPKLLALDGFPSLTHVIGEFQISNNESLKTINGFNKLMSISGVPRIVLNSALLIENNASLETLDGLSSLKSISAPVQQTGGGPVPGFVDVRVNGNPKLTQCCTLRTLLDGLVAAGAPSPFIRINISGNGGGCDYEDILKCEKICDGDVTLTSQAEVDAFNCTKVTGNLTVTGADITSLNGLSSLREVYGHLRIENVNAPSLEGLSLLDSIGGAFLVINNPSLYGIGGSFSVQEGIEISYNSNLLLISGFNSIKKLFWLGIQNNPKLTSVAGFDSVEIIQTATPSPFAPTGIGISNNGALGGIQGFQMLSKVGSIRINGNNQLSSLDGFSNVSRIEGVLTISDNSSLKVINAFENLVSIVGISRHIPRGGLMIENNPLLEGFPGLSSLKEIKSDQSADLSIINNASLKNIDGLSSLTTFFALHADKTLSIRNNAILENIDGLSSLVDVIQGEGDTYINITGNPMLTQCCGLQPLIDALSFSGTIPPSVHIDISQNGGGCTLDDILACGSQRILGFTLLNHQTKAVIQHFQNEMTIDLADPRFSHLMLQANTSPQQVGSVEFNFDGHIRRTENGFPYQFILPQFTPGIHTTRADVYSEHQLKGEKGISRVATFNVINSATVISFDVVNQARQTLMTLHDGDEINIKDPAFKTFLFRANTVPDRVSKVELFLNNQLVAVERGFPYEVYGNRSPGDYTLEAIPYIKINVRGNEYVPGTSLKISFKVVSEDPGSSSPLVMNDQSNEESLLKVGEDPGVTIFPVPVDSELYIKIDDAAGKDPLITIRTIHGLTVYQEFYSKSQSINTLQLQAGVYYLQVAGHGGFQKVVKFIKK